MVGIRPNSIANVFIIEPVKEALLCDVIHGVEQVGTTCIGVKSYIELGGNSRCLACCVDVTEGNHGSLCSEKWSNKSAICVNLHHRVADVLETIRECGHVSWTVSCGVGAAEAVGDAIENVQNLIGLATSILNYSKYIPTIDKTTLESTDFLNL